MRRPLALIVPTRNRPENTVRLLDQIYKTTTDSCLSQNDVYFILGNDEPKRQQYYHQMMDKFYDSTMLYEFPYKGLVKALNWASSWLKNEYECLAFMGDDHFPLTERWDEKYVNELWRLGDGFVYGNDLLQGERIPTQVAMTSSIVETLGFFTPPGFTHLCCDLAWKDLGEGIDKISYMPDVVIEHLHPANGKADNDEGYKFVNSAEMVKRDTEEYYRWKRDDFPGEVEKLRMGLHSLR